MGVQESIDKFEDALASPIPAIHRQLQTHLRMLGMQLSTIRCVIGTAVLALREQNAESDKEIAQMLRRCASDALTAEITRIEALHDLLGSEYLTERELMEAELAERCEH